MKRQGRGDSDSDRLISRDDVKILRGLLPLLMVAAVYLHYVFTFIS